ncbi:hypothetical protein [Pendulispora rubella]|uniref:hypothetical protein n=1 Tax=Pendulispora rubella TaxID=2741070 RepID=UPI0030E3C67F
MSPVAADAHHETSASPRPALAISDPGFEQGGAGWTFSTGTGVATNYPHGGTRLAYLDSGAGKALRQSISVAASGTYDFSTWAATGGPNGLFVIRLNGEAAAAVILPNRTWYSRSSISRIALERGDVLELAFESGDGWVNVDDLMISPSAPANPMISSSNRKIVEMFDWAKYKANTWAQLPGTVGPLNVDENNLSGTGTAAYVASYWAGYANRSAYYSRDMAHQLVGAAVLGLSAENKTMLRAFAASASAEHVYFPVWAFNFDAKTYLSIDYRSPTNFVREVPAPFELVEKANEAYRWSGDSAYVNDPVLWNFYLHTTNEFITLHDSLQPNGVAEGTGNGIFAGSASYDEQSSERLAEAGDGIASQYQAYLAMVSLARSKGDRTLAATYDQKAAALKEYFNSTWSGAGSGANMIRAYGIDGTPVTGWGRENSGFMAMKQIIDPGPRNEAYLDYIDQQTNGSGRPSNIESLTYLPDIFFKNHRHDTAWKWMNYIYDQKDVQHVNGRQGANGDYPEVSFTLLSQTIQGLMGVAPDAPSHTVTTQSRLPTEMAWLEAHGLRIGRSAFTLRHDGAIKSTLTNASGTETYTWEARFVGVYRTVTVNGRTRAGQTKTVHGVTYTYAMIPMAPGASASAAVQ